MENIYNSPFTYGPGPYYIPAHNSNYNQPLDYIHPDSIAGQLGLTPTELAPILQEQQELMRDELAQPPPTFTKPTTNHLIPATQQLGLSPEEVEEVLEDQREWMREEEEQGQCKMRECTMGANHPQQS